MMRFSDLIAPEECRFAFDVHALLTLVRKCSSRWFRKPALKKISPQIRYAVSICQICLVRASVPPARQRSGGDATAGDSGMTTFDLLPCQRDCYLREGHAAVLR